jgi:hypothetical protein
MRTYRVYFKYFPIPKDYETYNIGWKIVNACDAQQAKINADIWSKLITKVELIENENNQ